MLRTFEGPERMKLRPPYSLDFLPIETTSSVDATLRYSIETALARCPSVIARADVGLSEP